MGRENGVCVCVCGGGGGGQKLKMDTEFDFDVLCLILSEIHLTIIAIVHYICLLPSHG